MGTHFFFVDSLILFMSPVGMNAYEKAGILILMPKGWNRNA